MLVLNLLILFEVVGVVLGSIPITRFIYCHNLECDRVVDFKSL